MIYLSIDNDYHFKQASALINKLNLRLGLFKIISHDSVRNNNAKLSGFEIIPIDGHPLSDGMSFKRWISYVKSYLHLINLNQTFTFDKNDVLIIFTEYQLNNAVLAKKIKIAGGKTYLFDEGIGFYCDNSFYHKKNFVLKKYIFKFIFFLVRIPVVSKIAQEGIVFSIKDIFINKIFLRMPIPINRNVPVAISPLSFVKQTQVSRRDYRVAFFIASNFDCFDMKRQEMDLANDVIMHLAKLFSYVYIKIHPSDYFKKNDVYNFYQSFKGNNLEVIDNSIDAIEAIEQHNPAIVVGTISTVLFDYLSMGGEVIFTYHLLPYKESFGVYTHTLERLDYNFINSIDEITAEYKSNLHENALWSGPFNSIHCIEDLSG